MFMIDSGVRQVCIMFPFLRNVYMDEGSENGDWEEGNEISGGGKSGDCLASCKQMTWFCVVSRRKI